MVTKLPKVSLQTVWIGNNEQSVGEIRIHYSKPIAEILSSTHRAPWTRARMWTRQGHKAFENAQGHGGRHCPPLPQAMSIKNKGVLRVGVPSMQDLQVWAEQSQSSEDYKQLTLETFEAAPQWLAWRTSQPSQALQPPRTFEGPLQVVNMSEDDWEPDLKSEEEPPSDDESRGHSDGAGSSMGSDGSKNEEDWQAGSLTELHRYAGTHNLWFVEVHTTGNKVRQAPLKTGASYPDPSRKDSDSERHADQEISALRIQILGKRRRGSAQGHTRKRRVASWNGTKKNCETSSFLSAPSGKTLSAKTQETFALALFSEMGARAFCTLGQEFSGNQATVTMERND